MPAPKQDPLVFARHMLDTIIDEEPELSEWEQSFIISVDAQVTAGRVSPKQLEIIERIYAEKTK